MDENMANEMQAAAQGFAEDLKSGAAPSLVFGEEAPAVSMFGGLSVF